MSVTSTIKVLLIDDHRLIRDGLEAILTQAEDIQVIGSGSSGEEAVKLASSLKPDLVLMDIMMSGITGIEATRWIKEQNNAIRVILISSEVRKELVTAGIQCGIDGYLPKDVEKAMLLDAIRTVHRGERYFDDAITSLVFDDFYRQRKIAINHVKEPASNDLTKREREVLALVASGKSNRNVADELFISIKTVETHKSHILQKLGIDNKADLVRYAIKNNIISLD
ncbi:MAG TPA: response regulator transcription factor [Ohtaekwangia sp.]|nr:response regulator transcription factor [Ohtaekwangia sp.]